MITFDRVGLCIQCRRTTKLVAGIGSKHAGVCGKCYEKEEK